MNHEKQTGGAAKPRRHFDENFKRNAVELTLQGRRSHAAVARELGITDSMLYEWRRKYAPPPGGAAGTPPSLEEATREIARLRAEVVRLQERETVLKKSLGILSETPESGMPRWTR